MDLTAKQEKFCQGVAKGLSYSDSYRESYNADNMKMETINRKAKELIDNGKVAARVEELKQRALKRYDLSVDDIISELEEARKVASETLTPSAMVSASMGKAKLLGLIIDRKEIGLSGELKEKADDIRRRLFNSDKEQSGKDSA